MESSLKDTDIEDEDHDESYSQALSNDGDPHDSNMGQNLGKVNKGGNMSSYNVLKLFKECKVIMIKVIISILDIQRRIKKHAVIYKVKRFLHNSIKSSDKHIKNLEPYLKIMSSDNRAELNRL